MSFSRPEYLYLLFLLLPVVFIFRYGEISRRRKVAQFGVLNLLVILSDKRCQRVKQWLTLLCLSFVIIGLAGPQWGVSTSVVKGTGVDVMFAADVSESMNAQDIKPSRLEKAKQVILDLTDDLANYRLGMIAFAGESVTLCPLTDDHDAFRILVDGLDTDVISEQGTSLTKMLEKAASAFRNSETKGKILIIVSDGEDHDEPASELVAKAAREGIIIYTVGIGTEAGDRIPQFFKSNLTGFKKDAQGNTVVTKLNEDLLLKLASRTGGNYVRLGLDRAGVIAEAILRSKDTGIAAKTIVHRKDRFQIILLFAILFLVTGVLFSDRKPLKINLNFRPWVRILRTASLLSSFVLIFYLTIAAAEGLIGKNKAGNKYYREGKYDEAINSYTEGLKQEAVSRSGSSNAQVVQYNLGNALYRQRRLDDAINIYNEIGNGKELRRELKSKIYFNAGNVHYSLGQYQAAIDDYKRSLRFDPDDWDAKANLELALRMLHQNQSGKSKDPSRSSARKKESRTKLQSGAAGSSSTIKPLPVSSALFNVEITLDEALRILDASKYQDRKQVYNLIKGSSGARNKDW